MAESAAAARAGVAALRVLIRGGFAAALMAAIGAVAHLPLGAAPTASALRIALRTQHARVELCHEPTAAELAGLPMHMRQKRICTETAIDFRLRVAVDGEPRIDRTITHRGVRRNRPLIVDELVPVAPGRRQVSIEFEPLRPDGFEGDFESVVAFRLDEPVDTPRGRIRVVAIRDDRLAWLPEAHRP